MAAKIKKGDQVVVITGKDKGVRGEVLKVLVAEERLVVAGVNLAKRHTKPSAAGAGGIVSKEASIHRSNVALIDPKSDKATRVGFSVAKDGKKTRIAKRSGEALNA
ncbi:MAG: 50S ribosomal protein L24 [Azospirillum brasilense]|nr:MAG: 50S ribosomal protein L24 [Azospirillum brasilense]